MFRSARVSKTGAFSLRPVLPGEYFIAAVADDATAEFPEPKFLEALATVATTVRVSAGEKPNVTLTTVDAPVLKSRSPVTIDSAISRRAASSRRHGPFCRLIAGPQRTIEVAAQARTVAVVITGVVTTDETPARPLRHAIVTATAAEMPGLVRP